MGYDDRVGRALKTPRQERTSHRTNGRLLAAGAVLATAAVACGGGGGEVGPHVQSVSAVVVADQCSGLGKQEAKHAREAMDRLVDGCHSIPHGSAHFVVVLHPGGALQFLEVGPEASGGGELPMCVLSQKLTHKVRLPAPCKMEIRLEESAFMTTGDAGAT